MSQRGNQLSRKLDQASEATSMFISSYVTKMQYPVNFVNTVVARMEDTNDPIVQKAHLETLFRTLKEMDSVLLELMNALEVAKPV